VLQTALDLVARGYTVYLVCDAVSSQRLLERQVALQRLASNGVQLVTAESAIYEVLHDAKHPAFKSILPLVKTLAAVRPTTSSLVLFPDPNISKL